MQQKLTLSRVLLYSSASIGLNIIGITVSTWLLYFYAPPPDSGRPQYLPVTLVGLLLTVVSLWDAVIDPFIGHWSDSLRSRWGRRRPFLIFAAPVCVAALILIWMPPAGSTFVTAAYFLVIMLVFFTSFSLVGIPYDGTLPEMAPTNHERVSLSAWKNVFGIIGVMIGSIVAALLFDSIGPVAMGVAVGAVGLVTVWLTLAGLRETQRPTGQPMRLIEGLRSTLQNRQFIFLLISTLLVHIAYAMLLANLPYYVTLVAGKTEGDVSLFMGVVVGTMILFAPLWSWFGKRYSNRPLLIICMTGISAVAVLNYVISSNSALAAGIWGIIGFALVGPVLGGYFVLIYSMMGSVVDYDEMLTKTRRESIYYGTFSLAAGVGPSISALILPFIFETLGYSAVNPGGVRAAFLVMALVCVLGTLVFLGYRVGDTPEETRANLNLAGGD
jgi:glycoside/pentoside/hexuronide:cation symporter, GPH family